MTESLKVYLRIVEQPAHNRQRFRYACEGRNPEILLGETSKKKRKTFPTVEIVGYQGPAVVLVSCVEDHAPFRVHPNEIIDRNGVSKNGVVLKDVNVKDMTCRFNNIGIQCIKRHDIPKSLAQRQSSKVDPFKRGFEHMNSSFNPYVLRLCFQGFLKSGSSLIPLDPIVSNVVADSRTHPIPRIHDISDDWSFSDGGKKIIVLTNKVYKDDIEVHFTNNINNSMTEGSWNALGEAITIHKQHSISFYTPPYIDTLLTHPVTVYMYLYRPSLEHKSEYFEFSYVPLNQFHPMKRKYHFESQGNELSSSNVLPPLKMESLPQYHEDLKKGGQNMEQSEHPHPQVYFNQEMNAITSKESLNLSDIVDLELSLRVDSNLSLRSEGFPDLLSTSQNAEPQTTNILENFKSIDNVFQFLNGIQ